MPLIGKILLKAKDYFFRILIFDYPFKERLIIYGSVSIIVGCTAFTVSQFHPVPMLANFSVSLAYLFSFSIALAFILEAFTIAVRNTHKKNSLLPMYVVWFISFFTFLLGFFILGIIQDIIGRMDIKEFSYYYDPENRLQVYSFSFFIKMLPLWVLDTFISVHILLKKHKALKQGQIGVYQDVQFASGAAIITLDPKNITHISVEEHYTRIYHISNGNIKENELKQSLTKILKNLPSDIFVRVHRSYAVNIRHISEFSKASKGYQVLINNNDIALPVSRRNISYIRKKIEDHKSSYVEFP